MLDERLDNLLNELIKQWNIAERRIKRAEQISGDVVISAIFELRYAGRKLADALTLVLTRDWKNDREIYETIYRYLADAIEDCVKAKHDAIDATVDFVVSWLNEVDRKIGSGKLQELFPSYLEATAKIAGIQEQIAYSRQHRVASRDSVYDQIEQTDYESILALYKTMLLSKERVQAIVDRDARQHRVHIGILIAGAIGAVAAVGLLVFEILKHLSLI